MAEVADKALPTAAASAQLLDAVDTIQAKAMRAMVWQQAGVAEATIDALVKDIGRELNALRAGTAAMVAGRGEGDADLPRLKAIAARSTAYAKQLGDALDLVADPAIAVGYFRRTDATFEALRGDIAGLSAAHRAAEAASVQAARDGSHAALIRSFWIVGGSSLVMLILLPIVVAAIARPVRALTRTMTELAAGNLAAEVDAQDHRDELGGMARAVLVFKEHMVRARSACRRAGGGAPSGGGGEARGADRHGSDDRSRDRLRAAADRRPHCRDGGNRGRHERVRHPHRRIGSGCRGGRRTGTWRSRRPSQARPSSLPHRSARSAARSVSPRQWSAARWRPGRRPAPPSWR